LNKYYNKSKSNNMDTTNTMRVVTRFSSFSSNLKFTKYNKKGGWYEYIDPSKDRNELRKLISQLMRDERKRSLKNALKPSSLSLSQLVVPTSATSSGGILPPPTKRGSSSSNNNYNNNNNSMMISNSSNLGLEAKRFKRNNSVGFCSGSGSDGSNDGNEDSSNGCFGCVGFLCDESQRIV